MPSTSASASQSPRDRRSSSGNSGEAAKLWSLADALDHLRGFVADLAGFQGKSATLSIDAAPVMVTPDLISAAVPTLVQLLRNAVTHGIEAPMARLTAGKPLSGSLSLSVRSVETTLQFIVSDDGRGIEAKIAAAGPAAVGRGFAEALERVAPLGGRIAMLTGVPRGAAFVLTLPSAGSVSDAAAQGAAARE